MKKKDIEELFQKFKELNVLIVGDAMIDAYMWGEINRMSPEASVPIVEIEKYEHRLGGAANVALNLKSLGANSVLCSVVGDDFRGRHLKELLDKQGIAIHGILTEEGRKTTVKTRVISNKKHQLRIDEEDVSNLREEQDFLQVVAKNIKRSDVIILQDYNKGVLTPFIIKSVIQKANELGIPTIVDPKNKNFQSYKNCSIFKPNLKEIKEGFKVDFNENKISEINITTKNLQKMLMAKGILLTLSDKGICIQTEEDFIHTNALERNIVDVSGAGDTVISTAALCLAANVDYPNLSKFANLAGGLVCKKVGVVPIEKSELLENAISYFTA